MGVYPINIRKGYSVHIDFTPFLVQFVHTGNIPAAWLVPNGLSACSSNEDNGGVVSKVH